MRLIVTDTNIIIDLDAGGLLEAMFRLPEIEFCVPDVLYVEELAKNFGVLPGLGLKVLSLSSDAVGYAEGLRERSNGPSLNDLLALALARSQHCALLTGDGALRRLANAEGVEVHGTIWLTEQLVKAELATVDQVEVAYQAMRADGSRLPWTEIELHIRLWRGE